MHCTDTVCTTRPSNLASPYLISNHPSVGGIPQLGRCNYWLFDTTLSTSKGQELSMHWPRPTERISRQNIDDGSDTFEGHIALELQSNQAALKRSWCTLCKRRKMDNESLEAAAGLFETSHPPITVAEAALGAHHPGQARPAKPPGDSPGCERFRANEGA